MRPRPKSRGAVAVGATLAKSRWLLPAAAAEKSVPAKLPDRDQVCCRCDQALPGVTRISSEGDADIDARPANFDVGITRVIATTWIEDGRFRNERR